VNPDFVLAAGHMSAHTANVVAWAVIVLALLLAFWGLLRMLGLR
jgi:hypothetical protein